MSSPNNLISPSMRASGFNSCIRLSARRKVDLPQPLGPMMAVTALALTSSETSFTAARSPKKTERLRTISAASGLFWFVAMKSDFTLETVARQKAHADVDGEHEQEQHERARPRLTMPVVVRRNGVSKNLQRHRGDGFGQFVRPMFVAERGEKKRRGFARHARERKQNAGDNSLERGADDYLHNGFPF